MSRNEVLTLIDDSKTWWKVRNKLGKVGYVPSNYIQKEKKKNKAFFGGKKPEQKKLADVKPLVIFIIIFSFADVRIIIISLILIFGLNYY